MLWVEMTIDPVTMVGESVEGLTVEDVLKCFRAGEPVYVHLPLTYFEASGEERESTVLITMFSYSSGEIGTGYRFSAQSISFGGESLDSIFEVLTA